MKNLLIMGLLLVFGRQTLGREYLVHAKDINTQEFGQSLKATQEVDFVTGFSKLKSVQDLNNLKINSDTQVLKAAWRKIEAMPLRISELEVELTLLERVGISNLNSSEKFQLAGLLSSLDDSQSRFQNLYEQISRDSEILRSTGYRQKIAVQDLKKILDRFPMNEFAILADSVRIVSENQEISNWPHQWLLISNYAKPILIVGTFQDFLKSIESPEPFKQICGGAFKPWPELNDISLKILDTSQDCPQNLLESSAYYNQSRESKQFVEQPNSSWVLPAVIVSAGLAYYFLKDKQLVFHSFKF